MSPSRLNEFPAEILTGAAPLGPIFPDRNQRDIKHNKPFRLNRRAAFRTRFFSTIDLRSDTVECVG